MDYWHPQYPSNQKGNQANTQGGSFLTLHINLQAVVVPGGCDGDQLLLVSNIVLVQAAHIE